jgi:Ion channel
VAGGPKSEGKPSLGLSRRRNERWSQFAERVANAFGLVLVLVLTTYVLGSLTPFHGWTGALTTLVAAAAAVFGLAGAQVRPLVVRAAAAAALIAVILAVISAIADSRHSLGASAFVVTLLLLIAAGAILRAVLSETEVGFRTILGAISVYAIFGILFTFLYAALDRIQSSPFFGTGVSVKGGDFIFFSFTTLTTTGYGNLVPAGQPGKMFAGMEMLMGQIFLVTLVAGLVSLWRPGLVARARGRSG